MTVRALRCLAAGLVLGCGLAWAAEPGDEHVRRLIRERRGFMAELGATLRAAWDKFDAGDLATLDREARRIATQASRISRLFPPGSFGSGSRARAQIADQQEEFRQLSEELKSAAEALVEQAATLDQRVIGAKLLEIGSACRTCHTMFVDHPR